MEELRTLGGLTATIDRFPTTSQNPYTDPSMMESETDKSFSQSTLQQTSQKHLRTNDAAIMQREREINDIAKGIIELADIFKELQTMVIDQGTMLDRIDYNVERMAENVKGADKELIVVGHYCGISDSISFTHTQYLGYELSAEVHQAEDLIITCPSGRWHVHSFACKTKASLPGGTSCLCT